MNALQFAQKFDPNAKVLQGGHTECKLYTLCVHGEEAVLKLGSTPLGLREIVHNQEGYLAMQRMGLDLTPHLFDNFLGRSFGYILMEHAGQSMSQLLESKDPTQLDIPEQLSQAYDQTRMEHPQAAAQWIKDEVAYLRCGFVNHLITSHKADARALNALDAIPVSKFPPSPLAFTSRDFTPDNLFVKEGALKFIDPKSRVLGIPFIDLEMMHTLCSEIYSLPYGQHMADIINDVSTDLENKWGVDAHAFRLLGKLRQYTLSSRFRTGEQAHALANKAVDIAYELEAIL